MYRKNTLTLILLIWASHLCAQPYLDWAKTSSISSVNGDDYGTDVAVDKDGNTYVAGTFYGNIIFGPDQLSSQAYKAFLVKYDSAGNVLWARQSDGPGFIFGTSVAVDAAGNIYLAGYFQSSSITFDRQSWMPSLQDLVLNRKGNEDFFVVKYSPEGIPLSAINSGANSGKIRAEAIAVHNGLIYVAGWFDGNVTFQNNPDRSVSQIGSEDIFIMKLDTSLSSVDWAMAHGGGGKDHAKSIAVDNGGNVYATGYFDGDQGVAFEQLGADLNVSGYGLHDIWIAKFSIASGNTEWAVKGGSSDNYDKGNDIAISGNDLFVTGTFSGTCILEAAPASALSETLTSAGEEDVFITKYDLNGKLLAKQREGGSKDDEGYGISVTPDGKVYTCGKYGGTVSFGDVQSVSDPVEGLFVANYQNDLTFNYVITATGDWAESANAIYTNGKGKVSFTGSYRGKDATFPTDPSTTLSWQTANEFFVAHLGNVKPCDPITNNVVASDTTICGDTGSFVITGSSPGGGDGTFTYFWQYKYNASWIGADSISNQQNYYPPELTETTTYRRKVNSCGKESVSNTVTIIVNPAVQAGTASVSDPFICPGDTVNLKVEGYIGSIQWQMSTDSGSTWNDIAGATTDSIFHSPKKNTHYRVMISSDSCGSVASNFVNVITDSVTIICPGDQNVYVDNTCIFTLPNYGNLATAGNNCGGFITITQDPAPGSAAGIGTTVVVLEARSNSGYTATCTLNVMVADTIPPSLSCPSAQNIEPDDSCGFIIPDYTGLASASDNCSQSLTITQSPAAGTRLVGKTDVVITADDGNGNRSSCSFIVLPSDSVNPTVNCPGDQYISVKSFCWYVLPDYSDGVVASDNCGKTSFKQTPAPGAALKPGVISVIFEVTDGAGNTGSCSFNVHVMDTVAPVIYYKTDTAACDSVVLFDYPSAWDNCPGVIVNQTDSTGLNSGSIFPQGETALNFTAADSSGNTSDFTFRVNVVEPPKPDWAGLPAEMCGNAPPLSLDSLVTGEKGGIWIIDNDTIDDGILDPPARDTGNHQITYHVDNGICSADSGKNIRLLASPRANAGTDDETCGQDYQLNAVSGVGTGFWMPAQGVSFSDAASASCNVSVSRYDTFTFYRVELNKYCFDTSSVKIIFYEQPAANAGADQQLQFTRSSVLNALGPSLGTGEWSVLSGTSVVDSINDPKSAVKNLSPGSNLLRWTVTNGNCPKAVDEMTIFVKDLFIPTGFSPNNDNVNDYFEIPGIEEISNELKVFNRWGVKVFEAIDYKNEWQGKDLLGKTLPSDTYFFILRINEPGNDREYNGYIVINN